jgi:Ca2+/H+ antiporter
MSIKTFWTILIKILGLLLIFGALTIVPQWFYSIYSAYQTHDYDSFIILISILLIVLFVYFIVFKFCIYKSSWVIEKLKLDKGFEDEKIELDSKGNRIISNCDNCNWRFNVC